MLRGVSSTLTRTGANQVIEKNFGIFLTAKRRSDEGHQPVNIILFHQFRRLYRTRTVRRAAKRLPPGKSLPASAGVPHSLEVASRSGPDSRFTQKEQRS